MKFTKMHGIGNDYVYVDCTKKELKDPAEISKIVVTVILESDLTD